MASGFKRRPDFFEVGVSPLKKKTRDSDPPPVLTLAPFALVPKVCFSNVKVKSNAVSTIILCNPSDLLVEIKLEVDEDLISIGLQFSSLHFNIPPGSTETLGIHWSPTSAVQGRGKVLVKHINGDKKFSYITVTCSSVSPIIKKEAQRKSGTRKKMVSSQKKLEATKSYSKVVSFATPHNVPSSSVRTPIRRETYEVVNPVYSAPGIIPTVKDPSPKTRPLMNLTSLDEDIESNFSCSKIVSSSPQNNEDIKLSRVPLKEYNYNMRPSVLKRDCLIDRKPTDLMNSDSLFEISDLNFDRDSLEPAVGNSSNSPVFDFPSILSYSTRRRSNNYVNNQNLSTTQNRSLFSNLNLSSPKDSFYLGTNVTPNSTFTQHNSMLLNIEIPLSFKENQSYVKLEFTPPKISQHVKRESTLSSCSSINPHNDSLNEEQFYSITTFEKNNFDSTYPVEQTQDENFTKTNSDTFETGLYTTVPDMQQPVTFEISPTKPVHRKTIKTVRSSNLNKNVSEKLPTDPKSEHLIFSGFTYRENKISLYDEPDYLLHPYGVTTISDPFSRHACHPREWLEKLELGLIKWLNSLLTPPIELGSIVEGVDVQKLWDLSTASSLKIAPSREAACKDYVYADNSRMTALRKVAASLAQSTKVKSTIYNIRGKINTGFLSVKNDISLYHNQGARVRIVQMCMYYNPLWLRIALEVIYEQHIPLHENNIHRGLVYFLKHRLLSDQEIIDKNKSGKSNHQGPAFITEMNNFVVLKFLSLIYFLDQAKLKKIIPYDPCLFCKNSPIKDSESMLNEFIKEFLKCVGQFKKTLKAIGYSLEYRQKYLDEFDYGLTTHLDLRDGVRLTRTMETILKDPSYSCQLWTPAFSRIQKIHNVQISLMALQNNGYRVNSEITASDIVNGHREKIFSLLWQILHGFLAPRYQTSAKKIQIWWRKHYLKIYVKRQLQLKKHVIVIQAHVRGFLVRTKLKKMHLSAAKIQRWYRKKDAYSLMKFCRNAYKKKLNAIITIQRWYRSLLFSRNIRNNFLLQRCSAIKIQRWFRSVLLLKSDRNIFLLKRNAALKIQKWYRNCVAKKKIREHYLKFKHATIVIQRAFRHFKSTKFHKNNFFVMRKSAITIQRSFRRYLYIKACKNFLKTICATKIQRWYRKILHERQQRNWLRNHFAAVCIQACFRGYITRKRLKPVLQKLVKKKQLFKTKSSNEGLVLSEVLSNSLIAFAHYRQFRSRNLGQLAIAYNDIDLCTLLSPVLCLELSKHDLFFEGLWNDLNLGMREGPHLEIFRHGLNIILKLGKFHETVDSLVLSMDEWDGYNIIITLMGKFLEKNVDIFCKAATVFWLLLSSPTFKNKVKNALDIDRLKFYCKKIMNKKTGTRPKKRFIPSQELDWGYFDKPVEFLSVITAVEELDKLLK